MSQSETRYRWNEITWRKLQAKTFKLQKRIYRAAQQKNTKLVHQLQRLLLTSNSAKLLSTRKVSQDNRGRKTAGVDGKVALTETERMTLASSMNLKQSSPLRRVWIPKPGKSEKRPLGIPTIKDRAKQALVKMALEPEWEAKFEPNSYGFRPGKSCHDAIVAIHNSITKKTGYVLDADISGCFDNINHQALLNKLDSPPKIKRLVKGWLEAGIMDGKVFYATDSGTPQGGVISPLLANIALHGLEQATKQALARDLLAHFKSKTGKIHNIKAQAVMSIIRYADDFVVIHESHEIITKAKANIAIWLKNIGLELNPNKTRIKHTQRATEGQKGGFDFLGYTIRQFPDNRTRRGYKTHTRPSMQGQKSHMREVKQKLNKLRAVRQDRVIEELNPLIKGWSRYYVPGVSSSIFRRMDHKLHIKLWRWAKRRHSRKSAGWIKAKYFRKYGNDNWRFMTHEQKFLIRYSEHHVKRHIKVNGTQSPYDGDWIYWTTRLGRSPGIKPKVAKLMKKQQGKCGLCRLFLSDEDVIEVHHQDQQRSNNRYENLLLLHGHCHDRIHRYG